MKLLLIAVGQRQPAWAETAVEDYRKRFPPELRLALTAVKAEPRGAKPAARSMAAEGARVEAALPRGARRIVLDEHGERLATRELAARLLGWMREGGDVAFVIGGADGLSAAVKDRADLLLRVSAFTLPHALARVLLAEQLYRAASILAGHPYHRE